MLENRPSQTQLRTAIRRATHQLFDEHIILHDPVALRVVPEARDPDVIASLQRDDAPDLKLLRTLFAIRSRFAEDRLAAAITRGARQYVALGAGLDTFPWRQPRQACDLRLFMADHPDSLAWSQQRFRSAGLAQPSNTSYVPIDLEDGDLREAFRQHDFDPALITVVSLLGVAQYVSRRALDRVLQFVAGLPGGSELIISIALPQEQLSGFDLEASRRSARFTASIGEPWITLVAPDDLRAHLSRLGFRDIFHLTPDDARDFYLTSEMAAPGWEQLVAAIV